MKYVWVFLLSLVIVSPAYGQLIAFVDSNNPDNSDEWGSTVRSYGGMVNTNVNFNDHPLGTLNETFYETSDGVTFIKTGSIGNVMFGEGPGQGNVSATPLSEGEGLHEESNYVQSGSSESTLTISFKQPVYGAGIFVVDHFDPDSYEEAVTIEAFTGVNGTGTSLGLCGGGGYNFQMNFMHFVGVASSACDIRSIVITDSDDGSGDVLGYDDVMFATKPLEIPAPGILWSLIIGLGFFGFYCRKLW